MKNLKEAKELLEIYKSITLEQLKDKFKLFPYLTGKGILKRITRFGSSDCILCRGAHCVCKNCIYSFRIKNIWDTPCMDIIYKEIEEASEAEELFNAIQKRISYLTHIIEWYETNSIYSKE